ncbi:MAG: murein transglycosylase [Bacteroidetes bacterium]|nr:MAG: murein transglycosylase [Bacteroidota bacterium]
MDYWTRISKKVLFVASGIIILLFIVKLFSFSSEQTTDDITYYNNFKQDYSIYSLMIPELMDFCDEAVPLGDLDVKRRFDKELLSNTYFQSNTVVLMKRSRRWFPIIEPILKRHNIPDDFKYLAIAESNLTNAVSPAGAVGYWQLMKATAKSFGLEITLEVDERYNMVKSTEAACKYLKRAYGQFGSWTISAAAYNMGIDGIKRQIKKQKSNNYYDLYLNTETSRYIFRILAIKRLFTHPDEYGFHVREKDKYEIVPSHVITIDSSISNLVEFAFSQNTNYKILKTFNPWLRKNKLTNSSRKTYQIEIPDSGYKVFFNYARDSLSLRDSLKDLRPDRQAADSVKQ